eukprot:m.229193 g.229193  ORF g.229193 m.229193 type:complete len:92 (+) comp13881_c3_seq3:691-966(+)
MVTSFTKIVDIFHFRLCTVLEKSRDGSIGVSSNLRIPSNDVVEGNDKKEKGGKDKKGKTPKPIAQEETVRIVYPDYIQRSFSVFGCDSLKL